MIIEVRSKRGSGMSEAGLICKCGHDRAEHSDVYGCVTCPKCYYFKPPKKPKKVKKAFGDAVAGHIK